MIAINGILVGFSGVSQAYTVTHITYALIKIIINAKDYKWIFANQRKQNYVYEE